MRPTPAAVSLPGVTTLHEIARLSGVGKSTVSRVINGSPGVSEETRDRVLAVVEELKYTPNGAARTVRRRQSGLVAAVFDNGTVEPFQQPFFQSVLDGLKRALNADGYDLLLRRRTRPAASESSARRPTARSRRWSCARGHRQRSGCRLS